MNRLNLTSFLLLLFLFACFLANAGHCKLQSVSALAEKKHRSGIEFPQQNAINSELKRGEKQQQSDRSSSSSSEEDVLLVDDEKLFPFSNAVHDKFQQLNLPQVPRKNGRKFGQHRLAPPAVKTYEAVTHICVSEDANLETDLLYAVQGADAKCNNDDKMVATGKYHNGVNESGWGILEIETFGDGFEPELQAYAAGLLEGMLTKEQIIYHLQNTVQPCAGDPGYCDRLAKYLQENIRWIANQVQENPYSDVYWRQVNLTMTQLTGIWDGTNANENKKSFMPKAIFDFATMGEILMIQFSGDLIDLEKALNKTANFHAAGGFEPSHCSGLVKVTQGNADLLVSHVAMSGYHTMNRVLKLYKFAYNPSEVPGHTVSFSGYPGALASSDDYTLTSAGLLPIETTIATFKTSLYTLVKPVGQLPCWIRSYISNQIANTAKEWVDTFARYNSGTYNNQWTVVDYKLFTPKMGELPAQDLVWVLEQLPGTTATRDVTWFLRKFRYWPSYNIPFIDEITQMSGYWEKGLENNWWRWGYAPRARIFHRDHKTVKDLNTLQALMRYNDYKHDEFSRCKCTPFPYTAEAAPSTRGDLNPADGTYEVEGMGNRNHGALDYKGTDFAHFQKLQIHAVGGPTYGGKSDIPPFNWNTFNITKFPVNHTGQPVVWNFGPVFTEWETQVSVTH